MREPRNHLRFATTFGLVIDSSGTEQATVRGRIICEDLLRPNVRLQWRLGGEESCS